MATCTRPASLPSISAVECGVHFGQIIGLLFQRRQATPSFATETAFKALASWTPLLEAADNTKVVLAPTFVGFTIPAGEPQFAEEGTNGSIGGAGYYTGQNAVKPSGQFIGLPSAIKAQLEEYQEESRAELGGSRLTAYLVTNDGHLISRSNFAGISIQNFYISSVGSEGHKALNKNNFGFTLPEGWDDDIIVTKPNFDPIPALTDALAA